MVKNLQKSAIPQHKKTGILQPDTFARFVDIQYFEPTPSLAPFVAHYFVGHAHLPKGTEFIASDVQARPEVHLMLTKEASYIVGPASKKRTLHLRGQDIYAGVRFKIGGFYAFCDKRMTDIVDTTVTAADMFPQLTLVTTNEILSLKDELAIAQRLEGALTKRAPSIDEQLERVQAICTYIETRRDVHTVHAVAQEFGLSERTIQNMFASHVGVGVKWIILRARLVEAIEYAHLQERPTWTTIAAQLGYSTQSHFVNDFKKIIGMSPRQYLDILRTEGNASGL